MSEPLVSQLAQLSLLRITEAWGLPPSHIYHRPGPNEMAHQFLRLELGLPYRQIGKLLHTHPKTAGLRVSQGQHYYRVWPNYRQRYDVVVLHFLNCLGIESLRSSRSQGVESVDNVSGQKVDKCVENGLISRRAC